MLALNSEAEIETSQDDEVATIFKFSRQSQIVHSLESTKLAFSSRVASSFSLSLSGASPMMSPNWQASGWFNVAKFRAGFDQSPIDLTSTLMGIAGVDLL